MSALLSVRDLAVDFTTGKGVLQAVRGVDFDVAPGEILGIVGESGSGKSVTAQTLLRLIPGNGRVRAGSIRYRGREVLAMTREEIRRYRGDEVGIIFQEPARSFDPIYTVGGALAETLLAHKPSLSEEEVRDRAEEAAKKRQCAKLLRMVTGDEG